MKKALVITGIIIIIVYFLATTLVVVEETDIVIVTQFGKPTRVVEDAGLIFKLPDPIQTIIRLDRRLQALDSNLGEYLTKDKKNLVVGSFTLFRIADAKKFIQSVRNMVSAKRRLSDLAGSEFGVVIGNHTLSDFMATDKKGTLISEIQEKVTKACRVPALKEFGIDIIDIRLRRLGFPTQNLRSVYDRMRAERERMAKKYRAEGEEEAAKIRAATEKEVRGLLAKAYRESQAARGRGDAESISIYADAFEKDTRFFKLTRTLEAYRKFLDEKTTLILSTDSPLFKYLETPPENP